MQPYICRLAVSPCLALLFAALATAAEPQAVTPDEDFAGKVVLVFLDQEMHQSTVAISNARIIVIAGKTMLAGLSVDQDLHTRKQVRVSWTGVTGYLLFTPEEYEGYLKSFDGRQGDRGDSAKIAPRAKSGL